MALACSSNSPNFCNGSILAASQATNIFKVFDRASGQWQPHGGIFYNGDDYKLVFLPWCFVLREDGPYDGQEDFIHRRASKALGWA